MEMGNSLSTTSTKGLMQNILDALMRKKNKPRFRYPSNSCLVQKEKEPQGQDMEEDTKSLERDFSIYKSLISPFSRFFEVEPTRSSKEKDQGELTANKKRKRDNGSITKAEESKKVKFEVVLEMMSHYCPLGDL
jgi:hypothetical protein